MKVQFYGYIDNSVVMSGFLRSVYKNIESNIFYFHELENKNKSISNFIAFEPDDFRTDQLTHVSTVNVTLSKGDDAFLVIKNEKNYILGNYREVLTKVSSEIASKNITSKSLIRSVTSFFGERFKRPLVEANAEVYATFDIDMKPILQNYFKRRALPELVQISVGNDNDKFENYYRRLILRELSHKILRIPAIFHFEYQNSCITIMRDNKPVVTHEISADARFVGPGKRAQGTKDAWKIMTLSNKARVLGTLVSDEVISHDMAIVLNQIKEAEVSRQF